MRRASFPDEPRWPSVRRRDSGWWFTVLGTVLGAAGIYLTLRGVGADQLSPVTVVAVVVVLTVLLGLLLYGLNVLYVGIRRALGYARLYKYATELQRDLEEGAERIELLHEVVSLAGQVLEPLEVEIRGVTIIASEPYLIVAEKARKPRPGDRLVVLDWLGRTVRGQFEVGEWYEDGAYRARAARDMDAMWWGFVNIGAEHGVQRGIKFAVLAAEPTELFDPDTGEALGVLDREKVRVRAGEVAPRYTVCKTYQTRTVGGSGFLLPSLFEHTPARDVPVTLKIDERNALPPLAPEESYVKRGDRVRELADQTS